MVVDWVRFLFAVFCGVWAFGVEKLLDNLAKSECSRFRWRVFKEFGVASAKMYFGAGLEFRVAQYMWLVVLEEGVARTGGEVVVWCVEVESKVGKVV